MNLRSLPAFIAAFVLCATATAQQPETTVQQLLTRLTSQNEPNVQRLHQVRLFYSCNQHKLAWMDKDGLWQQLLYYISQAPLLGIETGYAAAPGIKMAADTPLVTLTDTVTADILLTDAAICFFEEVLYGTHAPALSYNGLNYTADCFSVPLLLATAVASKQFSGFLQQYENATQPYKAVKAKLAELLQSRDTAAAGQMRQLAETLNTLRWLHCLQQQYPALVVVNIASANLLLFNKDSVIMESRVIVGKKSTPTPLFTACLSDVVLYPYWTVPHSIATRELLPMIKLNRQILKTGNFEILDKRGKTVAPASIDWQKLNAANFPYTLRQSTGCDNALGVIKLNFYTPFGVYLHDTPWKMLFRLNKRFGSHGCIRVEHLLPIVYQALPDKTSLIDSILSEGEARHPQPVTLPVPQSLPIVVINNTAWVDSAWHVQFFTDPYRKQLPGNK